ncbi:MAG: hypothetical protein R2734_00625 [Nocardioides sp.]
MIIAADDAEVDVPLGSKSALAHVVWDQVRERWSRPGHRRDGLGSGGGAGYGSSRRVR